MRGGRSAVALGRGGALLLVVAVWSGCGSATEPSVPVVLEAATPTILAGTVGTAVTPAPSVRVTDGAGTPVAGVMVNFDVSGMSGSIATPSGLSDANGLASVGSWTLPTRAGSASLTARVGETRVFFVAEAEAGPVTHIWLVGGNGQIGTAGDPLPDRLQVRVTDAAPAYNSIVGVAVTFTVISGGGSVDGASTVTDADGHAESGAWTLGPLVGTQEVKVEAGSVQVNFTATAN